MAELKRIALVGKGHQHDGITRLLSPGDLGQKLKPFVFLDFLNTEVEAGFGFGLHPHSGIATLTYQLSVDVAYVDTEGKKGILKANGLEWMQAGGGAWHQGTMLSGGKLTGFQLWVALPPGLEDGPSHSQYLAPADVPEQGPVKVLLGHFLGSKNPLKTPTSMNYFDVRLGSGEKWSYTVPPLHTVSWAFVYAGEATVNGRPSFQEILVLEPTGDGIEVLADTPTRFLFGSAEPHPYPLVTGSSSVHTNAASLAKGEARILELGKALQKAGKLKL